nr:peptidoglycan-binding protein [Rhizobiaceae bacterium]
PATVTGAWAGEIGQVQVLPADYLRLGLDGDGDGKVDMKASAPDAILTAGNFLHALGWKANQPWMEEAVVPADMDWSLAVRTNKRSLAEWAALGVAPKRASAAGPDTPAALAIPVGRNGPAFLTYENFDIFLQWNQSMTYILTASYFATKLAGAPPFDPRNPDPGLDGEQMKQLQTKLRALGYDVGEIDGILGEGTRNAVRDMQGKLGMPADAWPTPELLGRI